MMECLVGTPLYYGLIFELFYGMRWRTTTLNKSRDFLISYYFLFLYLNLYLISKIIFNFFINFMTKF